MSGRWLPGRQPLAAPGEFFRQIQTDTRPAPGTLGDTDGAAVGLVEERQALVEVDIPFLGAPHGLLLGKQCFGRAGVRSDPAGLAKGVDAEFARWCRFDRRVGQNRRQTEGCTELGIDDRAVLA